jgi:transposase-like protein
MGRKAKYSKELKLEIVKRYLKGESSTLLTREYNISGKKAVNRILEWTNKYKSIGEIAFDESITNKSYSKELKERVIKDYLDGKDSYEGLANKYNISNGQIVRDWVLKYNNGIEIKDYDSKGDVYTMKSRKTTFEERLEIVKYVLDNNNDYKGAADKYTVPYASVYQWVKKYNECGEDGLKYKRGRPSSNEAKKELTLEEKQAIEIEKLKRELERERMVVEVLKKNLEIRQKMERDSRMLGKKINTKQ